MDAGQRMLRDDEVGLVPQADVGQLDSDQALDFLKKFQTARFVCRGCGFVEQGVHSGIAEMAAIEAFGWDLFRMEHAPEDVRIRQRASRPLQRVHLEVTSEHIREQRRELVRTHVQVDAD